MYLMIELIEVVMLLLYYFLDKDDKVFYLEKLFCLLVYGDCCG